MGTIYEFTCGDSATMKTVWICVKSPSLLVHYHNHYRFILTNDMTPKERVAEVKSILGQMMKMEESLK